MKSKITNEEVLALAQLSKLKLSDAEVEQYTKEIAELLDYFEQLDTLDLKNVKPTISVGQKSSTQRTDEVKVQLASPVELQAVLPRSKDGYIQVERMI